MVHMDIQSEPKSHNLQQGHQRLEYKLDQVLNMGNRMYHHLKIPKQSAGKDQDK